MQIMKECHEAPKQKERHIVMWTQQEDDILREQINIHGTKNWSIIASNFKDKTTRQCRRRWYTYLNSDCKKGGWSPEEDMILCEAQRIFGNRWTEIAKVVSGRTDNAVKNRFSTLCKKRAKLEALSKENKTSYINPNNKRVIAQNGFITDWICSSTVPLKKMRTQISDLAENSKPKESPVRECGKKENQQLRPPFAQLGQNSNNIGDLPPQPNINNSTKTVSNDVENNKAQETLLKKEDPKITALLQQAELLSSLALKVKTENTNQSLENAWKELQSFLNHTKEGDLLRYTTPQMNFLLEDFKDLVENLKSSNMGTWPSWRQPDLQESSRGSSEYSTGSTFQPLVSDKTEQPQTEVSSLQRDTCVRQQLFHKGEIHNGYGGCEDGICTDTCISEEGIFQSSEEPEGNDGIASTLSNMEFSSPLQVTPLFRSLAAGIPSPKFSESERNFLLKTLGLTSPSQSNDTNFSQPPSCRRALLHSL